MYVIFLKHAQCIVWELPQTVILYKSNGFKKHKKLFFSGLKNGDVTYVDDILLIGNDIPTMQDVKSWLGKCFAMKDLGEDSYILGIRIYRDRKQRLIGLSQSTYVDKILKRFRMEDSKKGSLPLNPGIKLSKSQCPVTDDEVDKMSRVPFASAIGSIMYAMTCTRPDVSFALSMVSRYQQNPGESHWTAAKNILKYLRNTKDRFLVYGGQSELRVNSEGTGRLRRSEQGCLG